MSYKFAKAVCTVAKSLSETDLWNVLYKKDLGKDIIKVSILGGGGDGNDNTETEDGNCAEIIFRDLRCAEEAHSKLYGRDPHIRMLYIQPAYIVGQEPTDNGFGHGLVPPSSGRVFTNLYVKNFPSFFTDSMLKRSFSTFGKIKSCRVMLDDNRQSRCFGFVDFERHEDAARACIEMNGITMANERILYVGPAQRRAERDIELRHKYALLEMDEKMHRLAGVMGVSMLLSNLDNCVTNEDLYNLCRPHGKITFVTVVPAQNGEKAHGFVRFVSRAEAALAVCKIHGCRLGNENLDVRITPLPRNNINANGMSRNDFIIPPTTRARSIPMPTRGALPAPSVRSRPMPITRIGHQPSSSFVSVPSSAKSKQITTSDSDSVVDSSSSDSDVPETKNGDPVPAPTMEIPSSSSGPTAAPEPEPEPHPGKLRSIVNIARATLGLPLVHRDRPIKSPRPRSAAANFKFAPSPVPDSSAPKDVDDADTNPN